MGRLIPASAGMEFYRNVKLERDETVDHAAEAGLEDLPELVMAGGAEFVPPAPVAAGSDGTEEETGGEEE